MDFKWFWAENTKNAAIIVDEKIIPVSIKTYINDVGAVNNDNSADPIGWTNRNADWNNAIVLME